MSLLTNLQSYWSLDGDSTDIVGANNGTDTAVSYNAGKINQGAGFNGTTSNINLGTGINGSFSNISLSAWIKFNGSHHGSIIERGAFSNGQFSLIMTDSTDGGGALGRVLFSCLTGNGNQLAYSTSLINDGNWHFLTGTYDGVNVKIYIDGSLEDTKATTGNLPAYNINTYMGRRYNSTDQWFEGSIDEVGIWSRALTSTEVTSLYNGGAGLAYPLETGQTILVSEAVAFTELFRGNMDIIKTESGTFTETMSAVKAYLISVSESIGFTEAMQTVQSYIISISENLNFTESMSALANLLTKSFKSVVRNSISMKSKVKNVILKSKLK